MTTELAQTVQRGVEIVVPLSKLKKSPRNARRTPHSSADIEALAASIVVKGVLQPPVLETDRDAEGEPTGSYLVTIGEGRRQALALLAKRKLIAKSAPVRCTLDDTNDAFEVSLDENVTRAPMHPADQFEAFRFLAETNGWSAEEVGARFGVSAHTVRQRLRLGAVSPRLLAAYRAEEVTLDQLMAFALSEDHARQEQVFDHLSYNRSPGHIRQLMTENEVAASDRRATFVGIDAYQAAGGRIRRDLFVEDGGGWFEDVALLERLTLERLQAEADRVIASEGWRWAEAHLDCPQGHGLRRLYASAPVRDEAEEARLRDLADEYDALIAGFVDEDALRDPDRMSLFAHCVSQTVNALRLLPGRGGALAHAEVVATSLALDMNAYWRPTAPSYFTRVSKAHILASVSEAMSPEAASRLDGLKKDVMAQAAAAAVAETQWLPDLLRTKAADAGLSPTPQG